MATKKSAPKKATLKKATPKKATSPEASLHTKKTAPKKVKAKKTGTKKSTAKKAIPKEIVIPVDIEETPPPTGDCMCRQKRPHGKFFFFRLLQGRWVQSSTTSFSTKELCEKVNC